LIQLVGSNKRVDRLDLYDVLSSMRVAVDIIERSVEDVPELAMAFGKVRQELFARYGRYLRARGEAEHAVWWNENRCSLHRRVVLVGGGPSPPRSACPRDIRRHCTIQRLPFRF
jgi:hypothetical protein